ncbi:hypothetical protein JW851_02960 [Candidatus Woesearchaeota archaeon]|nr:hypothetical protein [Candidatus Woesearchaeota archaeon]
MGAIKVLFMLCLLVLNFIGAFFLFTKLAGGVPYYLEIIYILLALLVSLIYLLGAGFDAKWSGAIGTILFALNLANAVCLYLVISAFLSFVLLVLFNSIGMLTAIFSVSDEDDDFEPIEEPVETYDVEEKTKKRKK